uniref:G_PROTEIN_RECEP_F1_2 domain-containing protein n=1 Tax=Caenorhabditis tropicalis TaxID=1561998 RepID=A0A1I7TRH0_9PELO
MFICVPISVLVYAFYSNRGSYNFFVFVMVCVTYNGMFSTLAMVLTKPLRMRLCPHKTRVYADHPKDFTFHCVDHCIVIILLQKLIKKP